MTWSTSDQVRKWQIKMKLVTLMMAQTVLAGLIEGNRFKSSDSNRDRLEGFPNKCELYGALSQSVSDKVASQSKSAIGPSNWFTKKQRSLDKTFIPKRFSG